ncbi:GNAT family N-acetyltransferase [Streptomyces sp. NPDC059740]|uniref:GNAT family N-acetyltransferase n=1 Tax=Streptomyces sp. NPDC059740 TaxID=3346926 RepID=UPI003647EDE6
MTTAPGTRPVLVRPATAADQARIVDLHARARARYQRERHPGAVPESAEECERWAREWARTVGEDAATVLCAERAEALVGVAAYRTRRCAHPACVTLTQLHVDPGHWSTGVGGALLDVCQEAWAADGRTTAELEVLWHNRRARAFYRRRGWLPDESRRPAPDATHLPLLLRLEPAARPPSGRRG